MGFAFTKVATEDKVARLAELASEIWHEYFISIISVEQINYMLGKFQSVAAITDQISDQGYEYFFMEVDGQIVGYAGVKQAEGKLFLSKFYIHSEHRGKGYASHAMKQLVEMSIERKLAAIWLTVNRYNHDTIAIYEKKGFKTVREQVADIGNGYVMDDFIMEKEIVQPST